MNLFWKIIKMLGSTIKIGYTKTFAETGYASMKNLPLLIELICETYDKGVGSGPYVPKEGISYCNFAAADVARGMGCNDLHDKLASEQIAWLEGSPEWTEIPIKDAQTYANTGSLVFAIEKSEPHSHICVIRPGLAEPSSHWGTMAPACMNIGKENFIGKSASWAFRLVPHFFLWKKST